MQYLRTGILGGIAIFSLAGTVLAAPAVASEQPGINNPTELLSAVAPEHAAVADGAATVTDADSASRRATAEFASRSVTIDAEGIDAPVTVTLPFEAAPVERDGDYLLYKSESRNVSAYASSSQNGVQLQVGIADSSAPDEYSFAFDLPDGTITNFDSSGGLDIEMPDGWGGYISPPWAKDSAGRSLPTSYTWADDILTQAIDLSGDVQFPVVADPAWTYEKFYLIGGATPASARNAMMQCFNCIFPVDGAPANFPIANQYLPLTVGGVGNFNCIFRGSSYYPPSSGDNYAFGFVFDAAPSHVDGAGSWISFNIYDKPITSGQARYVLKVYASIVNSNPVALPQGVYTELASNKWSEFANNLATKAAAPPF